ncbi:MAG: membrane protein insertase YidC [Rikenellaceae bacterium]|nr:membrane protein insertase YidC [Rikenellaceae bacterium]
MNKKTLLGLVVMAAVFIAFAYYNGTEQQRYQEELARYEAYQDSVARANQPQVDPAVQGVDAQAPEAVADALAAADQLHAQQVEMFGDSLMAAAEADAEQLTIDNEVMQVRFSTRGGQIVGVTLKEYTKWAEQERTELIELFDPSVERFDLSFFVRRGMHNIPIHTADYTFVAEDVVTEGDAQVVTMRLDVAEGAAIRYQYLIYNTTTPERDYLVDMRVRFDGMEQLLSNQTSMGLDWTSMTYQNERGFSNENMNTTLSYRFPGEDSIEELGIGEGQKSEEVSTQLSWVAFKQQFFSSVLIAPEHLSGAKLGYETAIEGSGYVKKFTMQAKVDYSDKTKGYDFAFYFGPNKYSILSEVKTGDEELYLERLIPLGWGIFGWINRWIVIPVFDFLRGYIGSFGIIILILAVLIRLLIMPLTYKSYVSMAKMRLIKPEVDALAAKFPKKEDAMKRQQATMELYKKAGVNPMGGCIPMLIQMPILIAMFRFFPASIELRGESFLWSGDLSSYDSVLELPFSIPFYGDHVSLFALLMALSTFFYSWINYKQTASSQPQMAGMKFMMLYMMPVMLLLWFNSYASGLCYYYLLSNLLILGQTFLVRRMVDDDKIRLAMENNAAKKQNGGKKSRFQQRYEELMRMQEMQQKAKKK